MITLNDLKYLYGDLPQIAKKFGISLPSVYGWANDGVPFARQLQVQMWTGGKLVASERPRRRQARSDEQVSA